MKSTNPAPTPSVADRLRTDVVSGHFPPNTRLIELQLTERYEVGRASIRSAIVELVKEGLVVREANRGATVRQLTFEETVEVYEARMAIEVLLTRRASVKATQAERDQMIVILEEMREASKIPDVESFGEGAQRLNDLISASSRHRVGRDLIDTLRNQSRQIKAPLSSLTEQTERFMREAHVIVHAVVDRDPDEVERAVRAHFESIIHAFREAHSQSNRTD